MAINKNFVVKNGFEVSTDLILANADTRKVGIGTTTPQYTLHVNGGIGATDFYLTGIGTFVDELNVGLGGTVLTVLGLGNSIGIGTALPAYLLDIRSPVSTGQTALYVQGDVEITGDIRADDIIFDDAEIQDLNVTDTFIVVGLSTFNSNVFINASLNVSGITTLGNYVDINDSVDISDDLNVVGLSTLGGYVDINDSVDISDDLNVVGLSTLGGYVDINNSVDISNNLNVSGIATIATISVVGAALSSLIVSGIATIATGIVTNLSGTNLNYSGVGTITNLRSTSFNNSGVGTITTLNSTNGTITNLSGTNSNYSGISTALRFVSTASTGTAPLTVGSSTVVTNLNADLLDGQNGSYYNDLINSTGTLPDARFTGTYTGVSFNSTGIATFASFSGSGADLTTLNATNISSGTLNNARLPSNISVTNLNIIGVSTLGTVKISSGIITATSGIVTYFGDGSNLTGLAGDPSLQTVLNVGNTSTIGMSIVGVITATDFNSTSDINLKENIHTVKNALETVDALRGVSFDWKETGSGSYGVIAQELEKVLPELVKQGEVKSVNYNGIIGVLIEAIKELKKEIKELKEKNV